MCTKVAQLRQEAEKLSKIEARDQRKSNLLSAKETENKRLLYTTLQERGYRLQPKLAETFDKFNILSLEVNIPQMDTLCRVHFAENDSSVLSWPVMFAYMEEDNSQTEFIREFDESVTFIDQLVHIFATPPEWDTHRKYRHDTVDILYKNCDTDKLRKIDINLSLMEAMKLPGFCIVSGLPVFLFRLKRLK